MAESEARGWTTRLNEAWLAGEEEELANAVERFDKASTAYSMEISAEKTKLMTNTTGSSNTEIRLNGQTQASSTWAQLKLMMVSSLKYSPQQHRQQQHEQG